MGKRVDGTTTSEMWRAQNRCVNCGSTRLATKRHCEKHRVYTNAISLPGVHRRTKALRKKRHAEGVCIACGEPAVTRRHCEYHRELHNAAVLRSKMRAYYAAKGR